MSPPTDRNLIRAAKLVQVRLAQIAAEEERLGRFLGELSGAMPSPRRRTRRSAAKAQQPERPELEPPPKPAPRPPKRRRRKRSAQPN